MTANELTRLRTADMGWTQQTAADRLGVDLRTYKYYEQGVTSRGTAQERVPRSIALAALALRFERDIAREMETA